MAAYRRIMVAIDGSRAAEKGLREAIRVAQASAGRLVILHVVNELQLYYAMQGGALLGADVHERLRGESRRILEKARTLAARRGLEPKIVTGEIAGGSVAQAIVQEAKKQRADLIVLGTHGRRGMTRLVIGSDAEVVVRSAPVPVLLVRAGKE
jgi:nucleotide-binding universal stress UspA family protein